MRALTDEQSAAADRRIGELLLGAGAGSGKTAVLVERAIRAIALDGVAPNAILAITFTNRAAAEMRERVLAATAADETPQVMTVHAFCARLLRANALRLGLDPAFAVLEEAQAQRLRGEVMSTALGALGPGATDVLAAYGRRLSAIVIGTYAQLRSRGEERPTLPAHALTAPVEPARRALEQAARAALEALVEAEGPRAETARETLALPVPDSPTPLELDALKLGNGSNALKAPACEAYRRAHAVLAQRCADARADVDLEVVQELLVRFGDGYAAAKHERAGLDYEDLQLRARALLLGDDVLRQGLRERVALLMVDEFQDVNPLQMEIIELLQRDNLFSVGDESQSIYGFRHADVGLMRARRARLEPAGASLALTTNFRSRPEILDAVNAVFADRLGDGFLRLRAARPPAGEPRVELLAVEQDGAWRRSEAEVLAQRMEQLLAPGTSAAVLLRAATDIAVYEAALRERGIATAATAGAYWSSLEVGDLVAYLRALANPLDEPAVLALRASPLVGDAADALLLEDAWAPDWFVAERRQAPSRTVAELLERVIAARSYDLSLLSQPDGERRLANARKLVALARGWGDGSLRGFVEHVRRQIDTGASEREAPVADYDAVRLMTIHAAKGLEFDLVAVADLGRAANNHAPDLLTDGRRIGLRVRALDGSDAPALDYEQLREQRMEAADREEERIFYVAMTRAREHLLLSGAWKSGGPITWIAPALGCDGLGDEPVDEIRRAAADPDVQVRCRYVPAPAGVDGDPPPAAERAQPAPPRGAPRSSGAPLWPDAVSYSSLVDLERCAYRWYTERVLGLPAREGDSPSSGGLARGRLVHALLERGLEHPTAGQVFDQAARLGERVDDGQAERIAALLCRAQDSELASRLAGAAREQPFQFELGEGLPLVTGALDAIVPSGDDGCLVVDYKTDHVNGDADLAALTRERYGLQREVYALAVLQAGAATVEVAHWFLERPHEPQIATFGRADRDGLLAALRARLEPLRSARYPVSERPCRELCLTCPARDGLCPHPPELTLRAEV